MTPDEPAQKLCFSASFPPEESYAQTAGELTGKLAVSVGFAEDAAGVLARQVEGAFSRAVRGGGAPVELALCSGAESVDITVSSAGTTLLSESRPRPR
jgi:hypothetical protein